MKIKKTIVLMFVGVSLLLFGCGKDGPAETAGKKIDATVEAAGEKIDNAGKKIDNAVETAGEKMGDAVEKTGDEIKELGDSIKDSTN